MKCESFKAILCGRIIDGSGVQPLEDAAILVKGERIVKVDKKDEMEIPSEAEVIDVSNMTVMPGLIDAHVHFSGSRSHKFEERILASEGLRLLRAAKDAETALKAGFTTMKCCGGKIALDLKKAIKEGTIRGPRIVAAGYALTQTFGHGDQHYFPWEYEKKLNPTICDGKEDCIRAARFALREGADFIKVSTTGGVMSERDRPEYTQFTLEELQAIVEEARHVGTFCTAHAQGTEGVKNAIKAGFKTIDHGIYLDEEAVEMMKARNVILVPTFSIVKQIIDHGAEHGVVEWGLRKAREAYKSHIESIRKAYESGVKIAMGTDFGSAPLFKMGTNAMELGLMVENCGMKPMDAIVSTTKIAAEACGLERETGTIEAGKYADLIAIDGDPLADVRILERTENIRLVMKGGVAEVNRLL
ncbi:MAG: amidohydrolase family protein [Candidatus Bathyarchaeia archaeon]